MGRYYDETTMGRIQLVIDSDESGHHGLRLLLMRHVLYQRAELANRANERPHSYHGR